MLNNQKGFSLIELMIVVVIIGLLATIGVPQYQNFIAKTRQAEAKNLMSGVYTAEKAFFAEWNQYYGDFRAIGFEPTGTMLYNVGFRSSGQGPATHPTAAFRGNAGAQFLRTRNACGQAQYTCAVTTGNNVPTVATTTGRGAGTHRFDVGAIANIDSDAGLDQWALDEQKVFTAVRDDAALN